MIAEIVCIGTELLLGQIIDTNSAFLAEKLAEIGVDLYHKTTVGDNLKRIEDVLRHSLSRADIIILSGGLGPTEDDCTREAVSNVIARPLEMDRVALEKLRNMFALRSLEMPKNNEVQAMFPEGAKIFPNSLGTAPGFVVEFNSKAVIALPGPPRELQKMVEDSLIPYICSRLKTSRIIKSKFLRTIGISESKLSEILRDTFLSSVNPSLA